MSPLLRSLLPLVAAAPLALGGCSLREIVGLSGDDDDRYIVKNPSYYGQPGYAQAGYQQPAYQPPAFQQPGYQQPAYGSSTYQFNGAPGHGQNPYQQNQFASGQFPTTGHWEWGTSPDGRRTRIWIPDNSYKLPVEAYGVGVPQPWAPPRFDAMYSDARGRYDTIRLPDGRLEHEWRSDEPSSPAQGYWQVVSGGGAGHRTWVPGVVNTASDR